MPRIVPGSQIKSKLVDPKKTYVDGRNIENLKALGALNELAAETAVHVDGLVDGLEAGAEPKGTAGIDQMVRAEKPAYAKTMFPEEKKLLPYLWRQLEWEDLPAPKRAPDLPALVVENKTVSPVDADFTKPATIADLPAALQRTAQRVQLVLDVDGDDSTVHLSDLTQALAEPGAFSRQEVEQLHELVLAVKAQLRGDKPVSARVKVSEPGVVDMPLPCESPVKIEVRSETRIVERRSALRTRDSALTNNTASITLTRVGRVHVEVPAGSQALLIHHETGAERLFGPGVIDEDAVTGGIPAGTWRVELWSAGERSKSADVVIPEHALESRDLGAFLNHTLFTARGDLQRSVTSGASTRQQHSPFGEDVLVTWEYARAPSVAPDGPSAAAAALLETLPVGLAPGRYRVPTSEEVLLDVFPEGAVKATVGGVTFPLVMSGSTLRGASPDNTRAVTFSFERRQVDLHTSDRYRRDSWNYGGAAVVEPSMQIA